MRKFFLAAVLVLMASGAQASSYLRLNGNTVDPILTTSGAVHSYSGPNLEDGANLIGANLSGADLTGARLDFANLAGADLSYGFLFGTRLSNADLSNANLAGLEMSSAKLTGADLRGANLAGSIGLGSASYFGVPYYDDQTDFTLANENEIGLTFIQFDPRSRWLEPRS